MNIWHLNDKLKHIGHLIDAFLLAEALNSERAIQVNTKIMRAFVRLQQMLASDAELSRRLDELEKKYDHR